MGLLHRLFKIPRTDEEYFRELKRRGIREVSIEFDGIYDSFGLLTNYGTVIKACSEGIRPFIIGHSVYTHSTLEYSANSYFTGRAQMKYRAYREAISFAHRLHAHGIKTKAIDRYSLDIIPQKLQEMHQCGFAYIDKTTLEDLLEKINEITSEGRDS